MKVLQVVPSVAVESSGPSYSVTTLCKGLVENDCDVEFISSIWHLFVVDDWCRRNGVA